MKQTLVSIASLLSVVFVFSACNKASLLGYDDLFADELIGTKVTDTMTVVAWTEIADSVRTYSPGFSVLTTYLFGRYRDMVVGEAEARIYAQLRLDGVAPDLSGMTLDSAVLVLPYDSTAFYARTNQYFIARVSSLAEELEVDSAYYGDDAFAVEQLIGMHQFLPQPNRESLVIRPGEDISEQDTFYYSAQLRIPLHTSFAQAFFDQAGTVLESDSALLAYLPGIEIAPYLPTDGMVAFDLNSTDAGLVLYYHNDSIYDDYKLRFGGVRTVNFRHDYSGSLVETYLNDSIKGQELLFLQGMRGLRVHLRIPYSETMRDSLINRVELNVAVASEVDGGMPPPPIEQIILSKRNEDGELVVIDDVVFGLERNELESLFGGRVEGSNPATYTLNLTTHFLAMRKGEESEELYLMVLYRNTIAARTVLGGAQHPDYPMKLKIYYTPLQ